MPLESFTFVSPGVFLAEVDNSQIPATAPPMGPIIIGRTRSGPGMTPIQIQSFSDFVQIFGNPVGGGGSEDVWRDGNTVGPTYGAYAAQAYLKANVGGITMFRLLGEDNPTATDAITNPGIAGWITTKTTQSTVLADNGGAYGLFLFDGTGSQSTGTLASIFYVQDGGVALTGTMVYNGTSPTPSESQAQAGAALFKSNGTQGEFMLSIVSGTGGDPAYKAAFNFNDGSDKYIRKVLNTNPQLTNDSFIDPGNLNQGEALYWLGESYESNLKEVLGSTFDSGDTYGMILALETGSVYKQDYKMSSQNHESRTGWFIAQAGGPTGSYVPTDQTRLFKIYSRGGGRWAQDNLKISIGDIRPSKNTANPFGTFSVVVRAITDNDTAPAVLEKFTNCNLNPLSENYVALKIGDKYSKWEYSPTGTGPGLLSILGSFANRSKYIRIQMNDDVFEAGAGTPAYLPVGVCGPPRFKPFTLASGSSAIATDAFWQGGGSGGDMPLTSSLILGADKFLSPEGFTASVTFPSSLLRVSASDGGLSDQTDAYFGFISTKTSTSTQYDKGVSDYLWPMPSQVNTFDTLTGPGSTQYAEYQWVFSMDDIVVTGAKDEDVFYESGSRANGTAYGATNSLTALFKLGYDGFSSPLFGGFDGLNIIEAEPFRAGFMDADSTVANNYAYNSVDRAIQTISDPDFVEMNLVTMPGITNPDLTTKLVDMASARADTLAIIDLPDVFTPFTDSTQPLSDRINPSTVSSVAQTLDDRNINNSYGCTYYPWVQIKDTIVGTRVWVPPSVVVLGTFASSQAKSELWFAPAGFNRGGLTEGSAGIPVLGVSKRLTSKNRDTLYNSNINPIASFPSEGIVVFGQKTLQATESALDRINVRRLMIYIKKVISRIANTILFDQNTDVTWSRFTGQVNPFLSSVQSRLGLTEFLVVLDSETTPPDVIDMNIMYAKIFLKPARAIEFIAIDFYITRTGASFVD